MQHIFGLENLESNKSGMSNKGNSWSVLRSQAFLNEVALLSKGQVSSNSTMTGFCTVATRSDNKVPPLTCGSAWSRFMGSYYGQDRIVQKLEPVRRLCAAIELVSLVGRQTTVLDLTLAINPDAPAGQVVRGGQGGGPCPDSPGQDIPGHPVDEGLPGDFLLLLGQKGHHGPLEGGMLITYVVKHNKFAIGSYRFGSAKVIVKEICVCFHL